MKRRCRKFLFTAKMRRNALETSEGRLAVNSRLLRAVVFAVAFLQVYNASPYDGITHAFSQSEWITKRQPSITTSTPLNHRRLVQLYETKTISPSTNGTEINSRRGNPQVRNIMALLDERYGLSEIDQKIKTKEWKKTRNYLYHVTRGQTERDEIVTFEEQVVSVLDFLDDRLKLPPDVSRKVLQDSPRILRKPVDSFLIPTSDFLLQLWGRDLFVQAVERNPALLLSSGLGYTKNRKSKGRANRKSADTSGTAIDTSVEEIIVEQTGLSSSAIERIKGAAPQVFGSEASKVNSVLDFLASILQQREGLENSSDVDEITREEEELKLKKILGKVILAHPYLLNLSVESNLKPRLQFLADTCDLNPTQIAKVVQTSNGSVLSLSVEQNLKPTIDFLLDEIFANNESGDDPKIMLKKCVLTHPQLLGLSLANLKSKVQYFDSIGSSLAVRVASKSPAIYSLNLDQNIVPTIDFLSRVWGVAKASKEERKSSDDFISMLHEYPNIITLSVESNLQPTMMFFNKTGYTLLNENWELALPPSSPSAINGSAKNRTNSPSRIRGRYIAASLYNRLLPRWHFCLSSNAEARTFDDATESAALSALSAPPPPEKPPLHLLVMASDDAFCQAMDFQPESFARFKKEAIPRLKFSSQFDTWLKTGKPIDL